MLSTCQKSPHHFKAEYIPSLVLIGPAVSEEKNFESNNIKNSKKCEKGQYLQHGLTNFHEG